MVESSEEATDSEDPSQETNDDDKHSAETSDADQPSEEGELDEDEPELDEPESTELDNAFPAEEKEEPEGRNLFGIVNFFGFEKFKWLLGAKCFLHIFWFVSSMYLSIVPYIVHCACA